MRRIISLLAIVIMTLSLNAQTVYITKTGTKYHRSECRYLSQSKISVSLSEAKDRGYGPCSVCKPPIQLSSKPITEKSQVINPTSVKTDNKQQVSPSTSERQQCAAITQAGTRCKRLADIGSRYCWQHQK